MRTQDHIYHLVTLAMNRIVFIHTIIFITNANKTPLDTKLFTGYEPKKENMFDESSNVEDSHFLASLS